MNEPRLGCAALRIVFSRVTASLTALRSSVRSPHHGRRIENALYLGVTSGQSTPDWRRQPGRYGLLSTGQ